MTDAVEATEALEVSAASSFFTHTVLYCTLATALDADAAGRRRRRVGLSVSCQWLCGSASLLEAAPS